MVRVLFAEQGTIEQLRATLMGIAEQAEATRAEYAGWAGSMVDDGGDYPTRMHTNALAMRFMIDHFTHIIDWAHWALDVISDWPDSQSPARDWADEAGAIYRDVARHAVIDDDG